MILDLKPANDALTRLILHGHNAADEWVVKEAVDKLRWLADKGEHLLELALA